MSIDSPVMTSSADAAPEALPLDALPFDNRLTRAMPADPETNNDLRQVTGAAFSRVRPARVAAPVTLAWSREVAESLGISADVCRSADFAAVFSGNRIPVGADPVAFTYGGHQFGSWAGQLGDGRAIALGEVIDQHGQHQTLQLKGAGPTPYSRRADGRAVLRSSLREFLCSEAMHHLGVPTTRALSLVRTGDVVVRDMLYDGHPRAEPGAIVCRVAPSFTRFGNFQLPAIRGDKALLRQWLDFTIRADFPHLAAAAPNAVDNDAAFNVLVGRFFHEVCERTARLLIEWMRVGFVHGVLNTDNMSILGLTIDYGPYGWLEGFDAGWTPNTTDAEGRRYRYGAQPQVAHWNLLQLGHALVSLTNDPEAIQAGLDLYGDRYFEGFQSMMARRLGWEAWRGEGDGNDERLVNDLFRVLSSTETDQVIFFRALADVAVTDAADANDDDRLLPLTEAFYAPHEVVGEVKAGLLAWLRAWATRVRSGGIDETTRRRQMNALNPKFVLRNYLAQEAIDAAESGDATLIDTLLDVLRRPYDDQPEHARFAKRRPEWARNRVGCSMLSCSS